MQRHAHKTDKPAKARYTHFFQVGYVRLQNGHHLANSPLNQHASHQAEAFSVLAQGLESTYHESVLLKFVVDVKQLLLDRLELLLQLRVRLNDLLFCGLRRHAARATARCELYEPHARCWNGAARTPGDSNVFAELSTLLLADGGQGRRGSWYCCYGRVHKWRLFGS